MTVELNAVHEDPPGGEAYVPVALDTSRGEVRCRFYRGTNRLGVVYVGGVGGDFDTPAQGLYPKLCEELADEHGISGLRVQFRHATNLDEAVADVLAGVAYLRGKGIDTIGFVGHSFGGAVMINAAAQTIEARAVVTLATQSHGAEVEALGGGSVSLLVVHGERDRVLPVGCSTRLYDHARHPKRLLVYEKADHALDEVAEPLRATVSQWLVESLRKPRTV